MVVANEAVFCYEAGDGLVWDVDTSLPVAFAYDRDRCRVEVYIRVAQSGKLGDPHPCPEE